MATPAVNPKALALLAALKEAGTKGSKGKGKIAPVAEHPAPSLAPQPIEAGLPPEQNPHLISAIAKIKAAHGIPLQPHETAMLQGQKGGMPPIQGSPVPEAMPPGEIQGVPYSPEDVRNAIEFGMQNGHHPVDILNHVHSMLTHK